MKRAAITFTAIMAIILVSSVLGQTAYREVHGPMGIADDNDWVEARVDTGIGFFGIGKYNPPTELMWDFYPCTLGIGNSNFIVRIDGSSTYGLYYSGGEGSFIPPLTSTLEPFHQPGYPRLISGTNTIHDQWIISFFGDEIVVNQYFQPDSVDTLGVIRIEYKIQNNGSAAHAIALEHKYDININGVDDAPVAIPGIWGAVNTVFDVDAGDVMPGYFLAAEEGFEDSLTGLVARGIINQYSATRPDFLAYGQEEELLLSNFSTTGAFAGGTYSLSGALLRWNDVVVNPGEDREIITYYGLGDATVNPGELGLFSSGSDWTIGPCAYVNPNTFTFNIFNDSPDTATFSTVWAELSYDTSMVDLVTGPGFMDVLDTIYYDMETGEHQEMTWAFETSGDTCGEFCLRFHAWTDELGVDDVYDTTCYRIPCFSGVPPTAYLENPSNPFTACSTGMGLDISIIMDDNPHADEGVQYQNTVTRIRVGEDSLIFDSDNIDTVDWSPASNALIETLTIHLDDFDISYGSGDTIEVCVLELEDVHQCSIDVPICWDIIADYDNPYIDSIVPAPGSYITDPSPTISFQLHDSTSGIDTNSVSMQINGGTPFGIDPGYATWNPLTNTVSYSHPGGFTSETWVTFCVLNAEDLTDGTCGPNALSDTCWEFFIDFTAPELSILQPSDGTVISCDTLTESTPLIIQADDSTCLDTTSGTVTFTPGPTIDLTTWPYVNWSCNQIEVYGISLDPGIIDVAVEEIADSLGNEATVEFANFEVDTNGPQPNPFTIGPPDSSVVSSFFACSVNVVEQTGLADSSILWHFFINGVGPEAYDYTSPQVSWETVSGDEYRILYDNFGATPLPIADGDTLTVCLVGCSDMATLCGPNTLYGDSICWTYFIDGAGPRAELVWPAESSCTACDPGHGDGEIQVTLYDIAGIDETSVEFRVDGTPLTAYEVPDADSTVDPYNIVVPFGYDLPFCPDSVEIELLQAFDNLGNSTTGIKWYFKIDSIPPSTDSTTWSPYIGHAMECTTTSPYDTIEFCVEPGCCGGFFHDSIKVILRNNRTGFETIWGYEHPDWWDGDCFRMPMPSLTVGDGDSIFVNLAYARDSLDYMSSCGSNIAENLMSLDPLTYDWGILISAGGPLISRLKPLRRYVSCPEFQFEWRVSDNDGLSDSTIVRVWSETSPIDTFIADSPELTLTFPYTDTCWMTLDLNLFDYAAVGESVCVEVLRFYDALNVVNEAPSTWCVILDTTEPCPESTWPPPDTGLSTRTPLIWAIVPGDIAPVWAESLAFSFDGGAVWLYQGMFPSAIFWSGDTAFCDVGMLPDTLWPRGGDTLQLCVRNTDNTDTLTGCDLNQCEDCWSFWIEANGPVPDAIEPGEDWFISCPSVDSLVIAINDSDAIIWDSAWVACTSRVSGDGWYWDASSPGFDGMGHMLKVFPSPTMTAQDTYDVWVYAVDELVNPLVSPEGIFHYTFIIDQTPPDSIWFTPNCYGDSVDSPIPTIWLHATDEWGTVDSTSWCVEFWSDSFGDWIEICYDSTTAPAWEIYPDSVGLHTGMLDTLAPWWRGGDTIQIHLSQVCDWSDMCPPNCTSLLDTCRMLVPSQGPHVTNLWPDYNGVLGCVQPDTFIFTLYDGEGVDTSTVQVKYWNCTSDTMYFTLDSAAVLYYRMGDMHDTLAFVPPNTVPEGCTLWIEVQAQDIFANNQVEGAFPFVYDYTPPGFEIAYSPIDSVYSFAPKIPLRFPDNIAGVDSNSVTVSLHSWCGEDIDTLRASAGDTLYWILDSLGNPDTLIFSFLPLEHCMSTGSTACLTVHGACDDNAACEVCTIFDTTWCFEVAQGGPQVDFYHPPSTGTYLCPEDSLVMDLMDPDGVNTDSITVWVNGDYYPYPSPGFLYWDAGETRLTYFPTAPFDTSEVKICIWGGEDLLGYEMDSVCATYNVDLDPPMPTYLGPASPVSDPQPNVNIYFEDEFNRIVPDCFEIFVDGTSYTYDDSIVTWTPDSGTALAGTLSWHAIAAAETLLVGDTIWVCMEEACDSTGCMANNYLSEAVDTADSFCYWFLMEPGAGPIVEMIQPPSCSLAISCSMEVFQIVWHVNDTQGLADYSLDISMYDGVTVQHYDMDSPEIDILGRSDSTTDSLIVLELPSIAFDGWIWVTIDTLDDLLGNPAETGVGDTCWFLIDWDDPYVNDRWPGSGEEVSTPYPMCWWEILDPSWKPDKNTGRVVANGTAYDISGPSVWWTGDGTSDTLWFQPPIGDGFEGGDTVRICVDSVADSTILCEPNWMPIYCDSFYINAEGPIVSLVFPDFDIDPNMVTFCDSGAFWISNVDPEGLDSFVIEAVWNGTDTVSWMEYDTLTGDTVPTGYFELNPGTIDTDYVAIWPPFSLNDGDTICLTIPSSMWTDTLGNGLIADRHWCAVVDLTPPILDTIAYYPQEGDTTPTWTPTIYAHFTDSLAFVGHGCVEFYIEENGVPWNGGTFLSDNPQVSWNGDTVFFTPDTVFTEFAEICIDLTICDSTTILDPYNCEANDTTYSWCFRIGDDDTTGPTYVWLDTCYSYEGNDTFSVIAGIADEDGVFDDSSTDTTGQGLMAHFVFTRATGTTDYWLPMEIVDIQDTSGVPGDTIYWAMTERSIIPPDSLGAWDTLCYTIWAHDNDFDFDNPVDRHMLVSDTICCTIYDTLAPELVAIETPDSSYTSCEGLEQNIVVGFLDWGEMIPESLAIEYFSQVYTYDSLETDWEHGYHSGTWSDVPIPVNPDSVMGAFKYIPGMVEGLWESGDTINVCVTGIYDEWFNQANDTCWTFYADFDPPVAWCVAPADTNQDIEDFATVEFEIYDSLAGVDWESLILIVDRINDDGVTIDHYEVPGYDPAITIDSLSNLVTADLSNIPGYDMMRADSLFLSLYVTDQTIICPPNELEEYMCVKYIKPITRCHASPQPFTPPPPADGFNDIVIFDYPGRIDYDATVKVYDMRGRLMIEIGPGRGHSYTWDGYDFNGAAARPGVYTYVVEEGGEVICSGTVVLAR